MGHFLAVGMAMGDDQLKISKLPLAKYFRRHVANEAPVRPWRGVRRLCPDVVAIRPLFTVQSSVRSCFAED